MSEAISILTFIQYGTPGLLLILIVICAIMMVLIKDIKNDIADMRDPVTGVRWNDTCNAKHDEINRRLERLEAKMNGHFK